MTIPMQKLTSVKFGDVVENHYASESNPRRFGVFIRHIDSNLQLTDMNGGFWRLTNDSESKTVVIGSILKPILPEINHSPGTGNMV